jgi:uncharacterized protein (DUF302 family)
MTPHETPIGYTRRLPGATVDEGVRRATEALAAEGFGVLTRIEVDEALKKKIGVDFRRYVILGACNPRLAHAALCADLGVGLLLPCNVTVFEGDDGTTLVQVIKPEAMFRLAPHPELRPLMEEADQRLRRALDRLCSSGSTTGS